MAEKLMFKSGTGFDIVEVSSTNPLPTTNSSGGAATSTTNPLPVQTASMAGTVVTKTVTLTGAAGAGAVGAVALFTVTGEVIAKVFAVCTTNLASAGGGTISVGTAMDVAELLPVTTATDIDAGEMWIDTTPDSDIESSSTVVEKIIVNGADIQANVLVANITGGVIRFVCIFQPISSDGAVAAA